MVRIKGRRYPRPPAPDPNAPPVAQPMGVRRRPVVTPLSTAPAAPAPMPHPAPLAANHPNAASHGVIPEGWHVGVSGDFITPDQGPEGTVTSTIARPLPASNATDWEKYGSSTPAQIAALKRRM